MWSSKSKKLKRMGRGLYLYILYNMLLYTMYNIFIRVAFLYDGMTSAGTPAHVRSAGWQFLREHSTHLLLFGFDMQSKRQFFSVQTIVAPKQVAQASVSFRESTRQLVEQSSPLLKHFLAHAWTEAWKVSLVVLNTVRSVGLLQSVSLLNTWLLVDA